LHAIILKLKTALPNCTSATSMRLQWRSQTSVSGGANSLIGCQRC